MYEENKIIKDCLKMQDRYVSVINDLIDYAKVLESDSKEAWEDEEMEVWANVKAQCDQVYTCVKLLTMVMMRNRDRMIGYDVDVWKNVMKSLREVN